MNNQTATPETTDDLREAAEGYMRCALWLCSHPDADENSGEPLLDSEFSVEDFTLEAKLAAVEICDKFIRENRADLEEWDASQIGHDLWLTRNGHGVGFWDRDTGTEEGRERLDKAAEALGEENCYFADGGIHWGY